MLRKERTRTEAAGTCVRSGLSRVPSGRGVSGAGLIWERGVVPPPPSVSPEHAQTILLPCCEAREVRPRVASLHLTSPHRASRVRLASPHRTNHAAHALALRVSPPPCDPAAPAAWPAHGPLGASAPAPGVDHRELGPILPGGEGGTRRAEARGLGGSAPTGGGKEDAAAARVGGSGGPEGSEAAGELRRRRGEGAGVGPEAPGSGDLEEREGLREPDLRRRYRFGREVRGVEPSLHLRTSPTLIAP